MMWYPCVDDNLANADRIAGKLSQPPKKSRRRGGAEKRLLPGSRLVKDRPVFRHYIVEQREPRTHSQQIVELSAGEQDRAPAGQAQPLERRKRRLVRRSAHGKGAVIVGD